MLNGPFTPWPQYTQQEADAVADVLRSNKVNYWTGEQCRTFEVEFANFVGCGSAIAVANGTVALDLALLALDIGPGDEVVVTSRTFIASVSCIVNAGATPIFADVDLSTQNITADTISAVISDKTKAVICVHLAGWPCDMDPIMELATTLKIHVIEDCAQAHGARYKGKSVGSIGHIGCWSFCQDKIMTTGGEGGMVTTSDEGLWSKMWSYKDHGKDWEAMTQQTSDRGFRWVHHSFGTNWRMTEIQAVIGRIQLKRLTSWQDKRSKYAQQIWATANRTETMFAPTLSCSGCDGSCEKRVGCSHAAYKCYVFVEGARANRSIILDHINKAGVPCYEGSCSEVYLEAAFDASGFRPTQRLPNAKDLCEQSLIFLCHTTLTKSEIERTCHAIIESDMQIQKGRNR